MSGLTSTAVMQRRLLPAKGLDFFPTPPWATRAFLSEVLAARGMIRPASSVHEPACGAGHMVRVLAEFFDDVRASDVHDYGWGHDVGSYVGQGADVLPFSTSDWVITNPPFNLAIDFVDRALAGAHHGVAVLLRSAWIEGADRHSRLFRDRPPTLICPYAERVPMVAGRYDPDASSATSYASFVWEAAAMAARRTEMVWIAPGAKARHFRACDVDASDKVDADRGGLL